MQREGSEVIDRSAGICGIKTEKKVIGQGAEMVQPKQRMFYGGIPQVSERKWR